MSLTWACHIASVLTDIKLYPINQSLDTDVDCVTGDGYVSRYELRRVLKACVTESELTLSDAQLNCLVAALLKAADKDGDGNITFEELCIMFQKYPAILDNLTIR